MNDQNTIPSWEDLKAAGQVPPASPEVLAHANRRLEAAVKPRGRAAARRRLVPALAAACVATVAVGAVVVERTGSSGPQVGVSTPRFDPFT